MKNITTRVLIIIFSFIFSISQSVQADVTDYAKEANNLAELTQLSKPAPNPIGPQYSPDESSSENQRLPIQFDIDSKTETITEFLKKNHTLESDPPQAGEVFPVESPDNVDSWNSYMEPFITPTLPAPLLNTTQTPWNTIYKLVMKFTVDGTDYFYNCSAWSVGDFHLVTAGHCIYNFDPNDDGDDSDQKWADEVWAIPAQTDRVSPSDCGTAYCGDWPYGWARSVRLRSYTGWVLDQNFEHDWGMITMDRNMGERTGWMGRDSTPNASLNYSGYPVQTPYVPSGVSVQYKGYDTDNVVNTTDYRIELDAYIYGGHSGGPSWRYTNGSRYVVGIHSTSNRLGSATDTLLTTDKRNDINSWIATDTVNIPPTNKADITEYLFDGNSHKSISKTLVGKGEELTVDYSILNAGFTAVTNDIMVLIMASTNELISTNDTLVGSDLHTASIGTYTFSDYSSNITIPSSLPAGDYTIGLLMSVAGEYGNEMLCDGTPCSNKISIAEQTLTVENCNSDDYEDDNAYVSATNLTSGMSQTHSICATTDTDWLKILVPSGDNAEVIIETSGITGDTVIKLYNSGLTLLETNDQGGIGNFSKIDRTCDLNPLSPGTYYISVEDYLNDGHINEYQVTSSVVQCGDLIFKNGFNN